MPIVYEDIVRGRSRSAFELPSSRGEVLEETFAQAYEENPIAAVSRWLDLREDQRTGPRLDAAAARTRLADAGMESDLEVGEGGITEAALSTLMERKRIERRRQETFGLSEGGIGEGAARLGVGFLTSLADPVSAGLNFVPVFGQARYARMLGSARGILGRAGVRAGVGAVEGAAGAAIIEPLIHGMRTQEQADYDAVDSLLNVALGGFVGSGLHTTVGSLSDLYLSSTGGTPGYQRFSSLSQEDAQRVLDLQGQVRGGMDAAAAREAVSTWSDQARRAVDDLVPPTLEERLARLPAQDREQLLRKAVNQAGEGQPVNVKAAVDAVERRLIESEVTSRLDAQEANLRQLTDTPTADADRLSRTYGDVDSQLQTAKRTRDEAASVLSGDAEKQVAEEAQHLARSDEGNRYAQDRIRESGGGADDPVFPVLRQLAEQNVTRTRALAQEQLTKANELVGQLQSSLERANRIRGAEVDLDTLATARRMAKTARDRIELLPEGLRQHYTRRLDAAEAEMAPTRGTDAPDAEYRAASAAAEQAQKDALPEAPDALPTALDELAGEAESEARDLAKRLGQEFKDADMEEIAEAAAKGERWARAAELATVCLVRGG